MTINASNYYTMKEYNDILFNGINYELPTDVINIITYLENEPSINESNANNITLTNSSTKVSSKNNTSYNNKHLNNKNTYYNGVSNKKNHTPTNSATNQPQSSENKNDNWFGECNFKTTKIEIKEGIDKKIGEIRILLNKISSKNYELQTEQIIQIIDNHYTFDENNECPDFKEHLSKITKYIFDIASSNKFFSELYAELYKTLINRFIIFNDILNEFLDTFTKTIDNIHYEDPNNDYDKFCEYTKQNNTRRSTCLFIVNLTKKNCISPSVLLHIIQHFLNHSIMYIYEPNRVNEVEEITENIFILVSQSHKLLRDYNKDEWNTKIMENIYKISQMKLKEQPSISNRTIFKYMDILDSLE
jgi:hypothetical protein